MKWLSLTTLGFCGGGTALFASSGPAAQRQLAAAMQKADIFHDRASPLALDIEFVAQVNISTKGFMILKWEAKDRWWRQVVMGNYGQIEVRNGERLFTLRNKGFTPQRARQLINLIGFSPGF